MWCETIGDYRSRSMWSKVGKVDTCTRELQAVIGAVKSSLVQNGLTIVVEISVCQLEGNTTQIARHVSQQMDVSQQM